MLNFFPYTKKDGRNRKESRTANGEAGEIPALSRNCDRGRNLHDPPGNREGAGSRLIRKSGDPYKNPLFLRGVRDSGN